MKHRIGRNSIKESFDNLPSGVCFADKHGVIILCNRQMHRLCYLLLGTDLQHIFELREAMQNPRNGISFENGSSNAFRFPNGQVWEFRESAVMDAEHRAYTQVQALPMTELYAKKAELERKNHQLEKVNYRAQRLYKELDQTVHEEETFAIKMRVHNNIGLCLLSTHQTLTGNSDLAELRKAGRMWLSTLNMFGTVDAAPFDNNGVANLPGEMIRELVDSAAGIGVKITINGKLPEDAKHAYLLITAMRECATNTVRHAHGSEMAVTLTMTGEAIIAQIENNGCKPDGEVVEGGGLSDLRRRVEKAGGTMTIESRPAFRLTVTLTKKEELP